MSENVDISCIAKLRADALEHDTGAADIRGYGFDGFFFVCRFLEFSAFKNITITLAHILS